MKELLIHMGYHKTGTTWLQNELFRADNNVFEPLSLKPQGKTPLSWNFIIGQDGYLLPSFENNSDVIKKNVLRILKTKRNIKTKTFVLTSERLSGKPHSSGFDSKVVAYRLHNFFPNAKILIVIREQRSFLRSLYFQYVSHVGLGVLGLKKYLNVKYDSIPFFSPHHINYVPLISEYINLFGKENVLVLPYELFQATPRDFIDKIGDFVQKKIDIDDSRFQKYHNTNRAAFVLYHFRFLNYFMGSRSTNNYSSWYNLFTKILARGIQFVLMKLSPNFLNKWTINRVKTYIDHWVGDRYKTSNKALSELIGIDLSVYNYHE